MTAPVDVFLPQFERYTVAHGGAVASVTRGLAGVLLSRDIDVRIVTPRASGPLLDAGQVHEMRFMLPRTIARRATSRLARTLGGRPPSAEEYKTEVLTLGRQSRARAFVVHNDPPLADALARENPDKTVALWLHNMIVGADGRAMGGLPENVRPVAVSHAVRCWTADTYDLPQDRVEVVHNGVDTTVYRPRAAWPVAQSPGRPVRIICHGRIDPHKGQVLGARAVARLRAEGLPVELTVVGEVQTFGMPDSAVREYMETFRAATREASAVLPGWVPGGRMAELLRTFDIALVLPTVPEPFSLTGIEAMASGLAVVAVPTGGVAEWVGDAAMCVAPSEDSVAEAIRHLVTETGALADRQRRCRSRALEFRWETVAEHLPSLLGLT